MRKHYAYRRSTRPWGPSCTTATLVDGVEDRIVPHGYEGAHIEHAARTVGSAAHTVRLPRRCHYPVRGRPRPRQRSAAGSRFPTLGRRAATVGARAPGPTPGSALEQGRLAPATPGWPDGPCPGHRSIREAALQPGAYAPECRLGSGRGRCLGDYLSAMSMRAAGAAGPAGRSAPGFGHPVSRGAGRTASAKWARGRGHPRHQSGTGRWLSEKSWAWRGLTTTMGNPAPVRAAVTGTSRPRWRLQHERAGWRSSYGHQGTMPASSFATRPPSRGAAPRYIRWAFATSIPTNTKALGHSWLLPRRPPCTMRVWGPGNCAGLGRRDRDEPALPTASHGLGTSVYHVLVRVFFHSLLLWRVKIQGDPMPMENRYIDTRETY